jgi:hypothetical protein
VIFRDARRVLREVQRSVSGTAEEDAVWYRDARRVLREVQTSVSSTAEEDAVWNRDARRVLREDRQVYRARRRKTLFGTGMPEEC